MSPSLATRFRRHGKSADKKSADFPSAPPCASQSQIRDEAMVAARASAGAGGDASGLAQVSPEEYQRTIVRAREIFLRRLAAPENDHESGRRGREPHIREEEEGEGGRGFGHKLRKMGKSFGKKVRRACRLGLTTGGKKRGEEKSIGRPVFEIVQTPGGDESLDDDDVPTGVESPLDADSADDECTDEDDDDQPFTLGGLSYPSRVVVASDAARCSSGRRAIDPLFVPSVAAAQANAGGDDDDENSSSEDSDCTEDNHLATIWEENEEESGAEEDSSSSFSSSPSSLAAAATSASPPSTSGDESIDNAGVAGILDALAFLDAPTLVALRDEEPARDGQFRRRACQWIRPVDDWRMVVNRADRRRFTLEPFEARALSPVEEEEEGEREEEVAKKGEGRRRKERKRKRRAPPARAESRDAAFRLFGDEEWFLEQVSGGESSGSVGGRYREPSPLEVCLRADLQEDFGIPGLLEEEEEEEEEEVPARPVVRLPLSWGEPAIGRHDDSLGGGEEEEEEEEGPARPVVRLPRCAGEPATGRRDGSLGGGEKLAETKAKGKGRALEEEDAAEEEAAAWSGSAKENSLLPSASFDWASLSFRDNGAESPESLSFSALV